MQDMPNDKLQVSLCSAELSGDRSRQRRQLTVHVLPVNIIDLDFVNDVASRVSRAGAQTSTRSGEVWEVTQQRRGRCCKLQPI